MSSSSLPRASEIPSTTRDDSPHTKGRCKSLNEGLTTDPVDAPAELLYPFATLALTVANGDLVFARLLNAGLNPGSARRTCHGPRDR